ncbi:hypothetical protein [Couchioplanes caeruleus]|nr:hypothetical protein [Couchioplanes caeruleus]
MSEADSEVTKGKAAQEGPERASSPGIVLAVAGLLWTAAMIWSARASITRHTNAEMEVTSTAYAMPGAVSASLVAGAAVALAVRAFLARNGREPGATVRFVLATGAGLAVGLLGALAFFTINTEGWIYAVVAGTVAAAATIGGALAGFRYPRVTAAACAGAIAVFLVRILLTFAQDTLLPALGAGDTAASQASAAGYFGFVQGALGGLAAGLVTHRLMRHARRRSGTDVKWPLYALAGAGPGLLLVVSELLTRTAGARVLELAGKISELELTVQQVLSGTRLNIALVVLFVGTFTAMIAVGRTLGSPADPSASASATTAVSAPTQAPADPEEIERAARAEDTEPVGSQKDD